MGNDTLPALYYVLIVLGFALNMSVIGLPLGALCWYKAYRIDQDYRVNNGESVTPQSS